MNAPAPPRRPNRLAKLVFQPGGVSMDEAVRAADANLAAIRGGLVAEVAATLERIQDLGEALRGGPDWRALAEIYALANSAIGLAGASGLLPLSQAHHSLCELIDQMQASDDWRGPALQVHLDCLRLLRPGTREPEDQQRAAVAALRRLVRRV